MTRNTRHPSVRSTARGRASFAAVAVLGAGALVVSACGQSSGGGTGSAVKATTQTDKGSNRFTLDPPSIKPYCGTKPFKLGAIDGFGGNAWRVEVRKLLAYEASQCPNSKGVDYFDSNLDPQKYISTLSSWTAKGVNVVVAYDDFGQSAVPAFHKAYKNGVQVTTHNAIPGNAEPGKQMTAKVVPSATHIAEGVAEFYKKVLPGGKGGLVFLGGTPGNLLDPWMISGLERVLARPEYAGIRLLQPDPAVTNWDFGKAQQVTAGLINKYGDRLNGFVTSYVSMTPSVHRGFKAAGKPMVPVTGIASSNEVVCLIRKEGAKDVPVYSQDGTINEALLALRKGLAAYEGIKNTEDTLVNLPTYIDTASGKVPACNASLPPGADLSVGPRFQQLLPQFLSK
jgi:ABC-type sugar transport system substrate-binding protein